MVGGELKESGTDGARETNWKNKKKHIIPVGKPKKAHFGGSRAK